MNPDPCTASRSSRSRRLAEPLVSVVTPSLNQGRFLERTLRSVLEQGYPRLEYRVYDGGSTDGTLEILHAFAARYPDVFAFESMPDRGQAHAVNKGFDRARGEIVGWLNSDDTYQPDALRAVARAFAERPGWDAVYGRAHYVSADDRLLGVYPTRPELSWQALAGACHLCQPAVFLRRRVLERGLRLDENLRMCMDYDLWIRLVRRAPDAFGYLDRHLANSRMYLENKTFRYRSQVYAEIFRTVKKHYGWLPFSWALGRAHHVWDGGDPFFNRRPVTRSAYLLAASLVLWHNGARPRAWPALAAELWKIGADRLRRRWRALETPGSKRRSSS